MLKKVIKWPRNVTILQHVLKFQVNHIIFPGRRSKRKSWWESGIIRNERKKKVVSNNKSVFIFETSLETVVVLMATVNPFTADPVKVTLCHTGLTHHF